MLPADQYSPFRKHSTFTTIIENPNNKKYFAISTVDKLRGICKETYWDLENCVGLFTLVAGVHEDDFKYEECKEIQYIPSTAIPVWIDSINKIEEVYTREKNIPEKLLFRGGEYLFRKWIYDNDTRFNFISTAYIGGRISPSEFIEELAMYSINVDFNGVAEMSCRTLEAMGLRTAVIRPKLTAKFHNPLIPDYHYAAVKCDDLSDYKTLADAYIDRFEDLKKDAEFVQFLSLNGRLWYEQNASFESAIKLYMGLMDIYKLV
jgi:hypothetical protein